MITFKHKGDLSKTTKFLQKANKFSPDTVMDKYGRAGVAALMSATPRDTGKTASSWSYRIEGKKSGTVKLVFYNSNVNKGVNIAVILQYGHGTRGGGWVEGRDYINPALRPIFDKIADEAWKEVSGY